MNDSKIRKLLIAGLVLTGGFCVGQGFAGGCVMADDMSGKEATPPKSPPPPGQLPLIEEQGKKGDPMAPEKEKPVDSANEDYGDQEDVGEPVEGSLQEK